MQKKKYWKKNYRVLFWFLNNKNFILHFIFCLLDLYCQEFRRIFLFFVKYIVNNSRFNHLSLPTQAINTICFILLTLTHFLYFLFYRCSLYYILASLLDFLNEMFQTMYGHFTLHLKSNNNDNNKNIKNNHFQVANESIILNT